MFSIRQLADGLAPLGFFLESETDTDAYFVRPNTARRLFESVEVSAGKDGHLGRWGDSAGADVAIALTPGYFTAMKGLAETETLSGWSPTKTTAQAVVWERAIIAGAVPKLESLVEAKAAVLHDRTALVQAAVERYLAFLDQSLVPADMLEELSEGATDAELREARRLSRTEGFICLPERACYDVISLLIARHAKEVESDGTNFWGQCPNAVPELNWRFQLLASRLYPERGWDLLEP